MGNGVDIISSITVRKRTPKYFTSQVQKTCDHVYTLLKLLPRTMKGPCKVRDRDG